MKILLIYPYFLDERLHGEDIKSAPIGMYYLGAVMIENGYDVEILNWHDINKTPHIIEEILKDKNPDVIGLSIVHANRWGGIEIAKTAKEILPNVVVVFGGIGTTFLWELLMKHFLEIDFAVLGEGEYSFLNLIRCIEGKRGINDIAQIRGIAYRQAGEIKRTANAELIDNIDTLPMPSKYFKFQHIPLSRGCLSNCSFCGSPEFWRHKVRFHSAAYFMEQIECLYYKGVNFFYVSDDTFTVNSKRVIDICKSIIQKQLKITWFAISRVNYIDEEMLYWMRKAGCIQISYGVESGSERMRKKLNKDIKTDDIKKAFKLTMQYGIMARAYFIYGSPGENWETIQETIDLIHEIKPLSAIFYILDIFPGTALYEDFRHRTKFNDDIWLKKIEDIMYFESDALLSKEMILAFGDKLRSDYYAHLPKFAEAIELVDRKDLYECHSDFLSRLAMTFSHGEYSSIEAILDKEEIALMLYKKSLQYHPNESAFLGLGIIYQKRRLYQESIGILSEGHRYFASSELLANCLGVSYINLGQYERALECFLQFPNSMDAVRFAASCYRLLGNKEKEAAMMKRLDGIN